MDSIASAPRAPLRFGVVLPVELGLAAGGGYEETLRVAQLAESIGYDFATVSHHRWMSRYPSAPMVLLSAIATRTSSLRLGTNILMLPTMDPLHLAEQVATVDRISNGRVFLAVGVGYRSGELEPSGIRFGDRGARMTEGLEILRSVLAETDVSYAGEHFRFDALTVQPRPVQSPAPPIFVGAQKRNAIRRAARLGDGWTTDSKTSIAELAPLIRLFRETVAADPDPRPRAISITRDVGIAGSRRQVEETWLPSVAAVFADYFKAGLRFPDAEDFSARLAAGESVNLRALAADRFIAGTPADCIEDIDRLVTHTGCDQLLIRVGYGPVFDERALRLFADEVMPVFR